MHENWFGWKYFVGTVYGILIILFESLKEAFGNCRELEGLDPLVCPEVSGRFINVSDNSLLVHEQKNYGVHKMAYIDEVEYIWAYVGVFITLWNENVQWFSFPWYLIVDMDISGRKIIINPIKCAW